MKMIKEEKPIFHKVFLVVVLIFLVNITMFFYKYGSNKSLTGSSIKETIAEAYTNIPPSSRIILMAQWLILIFVLIYSYIKDKGIISRKNEIVDIDLKKMSEKQGTDLDNLYNILQNKKKLSLSTISRVFNINKEMAMDWCRILESGNLAIIDYPAGGPVVKLNE